MWLQPALTAPSCNEGVLVPEPFQGHPPWQRKTGRIEIPQKTRMGDDDSSNIRLKLGHAGSDVRLPLALAQLVALGGLRLSCVGLVVGTCVLRRDSA